MHVIEYDLIVIVKFLFYSTVISELGDPTQSIVMLKLCRSVYKRLMYHVFPVTLRGRSLQRGKTQFRGKAPTCRLRNGDRRRRRHTGE